MRYDADVIVVGAGPVGATTLALLGHAGLTAIGLEKDTAPWSYARAVHFDGETLRTLQGLGIADEVAARTRPMVKFRFVNEDDEPLVAAEIGQFGSQAWPDNVLFHQPEIEPIMCAAVERRSSVELRRGVTVLDLTQDDSGVDVRVQAADGTVGRLRSRYVVAADGGSSPMRHLLGVSSERLGTDDPWLVVDGILRDAPGIDADMAMLGHWSRPALWIRQLDDRVRMEFKVMPGDDLDEIVTSAGIERVSRGVLDQAHFTADRSAIYTFRARLAERWRVGNVFLAGDAAHLAPPLFGQGLCAGMRDAANLVWKLRAVLRGDAGDDLLDTYESERKEHARYWVQNAANMAGLVQATDPQVAAGRDAHMRANPGPANPPPPPLGPGVHADPADGHAGHLSRQPILADGRRLDDVVGLRFLVAADAALLEALPAGVHAQLQHHAEIALLSDLDILRALLPDVDAAAVIVRPDHYVLGVAHNADEFIGLLGLVPSLVVETAGAQ